MASSDQRFFLSYRREDAAGHAGRLADHLLDRFGRGSVFVDVDSIEAGADFIAEIETAIGGSDAVLVVIGPGWLNARTSSGTRRLDEPADFVRREVEAAMASEVRVIPLLVGGATMPTEAELPSSIAALSRRHALELQDRRWREDVDALVNELEGRGRGALGNLPPQPTSFLGRESELAELTELLRRQEVRLLTLTGPGGIGKTRLAIQAAVKVAHTYLGGVWFVDLAALTDSNLVLLEMARVLEIRDATGDALIETIARRLSHERALIVLDNLEQLLPEAASPIAEVSAASPSLDLILTSRQPLRVSAEREYPLETMAADDGVALLIARARASHPDFELRSEAERDAAHAVCERLDGLPLAIELAASRMRVLSPEELLARIGRRLAVLIGGAKDAPSRHQTLWATVDWSYELLPPTDQQLFARLSIFAGGWTLKSAEAVCGPVESGGDFLDGLESLAESSLVQRQAIGVPSRFSMLETVREYAWEVLGAGAEFDEVARRHAQYLLSEAELAHSELRKGNAGGLWFDRLEPELDNFRAAISWSLERGPMSLALRIMAALTASLEPVGYWQEAQTVGLEEVLARSADLKLPERAELLYAAGSLIGYQGQTAPAQALLEEAIEIAREVSDQRTLARALPRLAWVLVVRGENIDASIALGEEGVRLARTLDDPWLLAETLNDLSSAYGDLEHSPRAVSLIRESLELRRSIGYTTGIADSLNNLGWQALLCEDYPTAVEYLQESIELAASVSTRFMLFARDNLALAHLFLGEPELAKELFLENLRTCRAMGDRRIAEEALTGLAGVAGLARDWDRAAWLAGAAIALGREIEILPSSISLRIRQRWLSEAREELGTERFEEHFERGRQASFEEAIAYALDGTARSDR